MRQLIVSMLVICLLWPSGLIADIGVSKLKEQSHFLSKNIEAFDRLLYKNKQHQNQQVQRSNLLKTQIDQRIELIHLIEQEVKQLDEVILDKEQEIIDLECLLEAHVEGYHSILTNSYRNRFSLKPVYYVFSSKGFWNAYKRWQYIQSFNALLKSRSDQIIATRNSLQHKMKALSTEILEKRVLHEEHQCQKQAMRAELKESKTLIKQLKKSGKHFNTKLKKHKSNQELLERYAPKGKTRKPASKTSNKTKQAHTTAFANNKGKLAWPVRKVRVSKRHGAHKHPVFPDISYFHNGIDIRTNSKQTVSIHKGEVMDVFLTTGQRYTVLLQHGDYFSLYSNLAAVDVTLGEKVKKGQKIGILKKRTGDKTNKLHLELWKDKQGLNPEIWLKR